MDGTRNIMNSTVRGCFQCQENLVPLMTAVPYVFNIPFATDMPQFEITGLPYPVPSQRRPDQPANNRRGEEISNEDIRNRPERRPRSNDDIRSRPERRERSNEDTRSRPERRERSYDRDRERRQQRRQHSNNDRRR